MQQLILALTINGLVFAGAGLGPMALLAPRLGALAVLALAPAAGYALYSTVLTWWLLQEGTAGAAAWPLAGLLLAVSAACLAACRDTLRPRLAAVSPKRLLAGAAGAVLCLGLLLAPLAAGKKGYDVFRGNASDSFIYMFIARYFDEHPRAWAFEQTPEAAEAAGPMLVPAQSMMSIRWTSGAMLTAGARLGGLGIVEYQYAFTLTSFVLLFAALLPFLAAMGLSAPAASLSALALSTGFYAQMVLDIRAFSQINVLPLAALLALALSLPAPAGRRETLGRLGLLAGCYLAAFVNYTEIFPMVAGASASYLVLRRALGRLPWAEAGVHAAGFLLGMAATWPVRFLWGHMLAQIQFTQGAPQLWSEAYFTWLYHNLPSGLFGLPLLEYGFSRLPGWSFCDLPGWLVTGLGLGLGGLYVLGGLRAANDAERRAPLCALTFSLVSLAAFAVFWLRGAPWVAGKGLSYFYPMTAAVALYAALARPAGKPVLPRPAAYAAVALAGVLLAGQLVAAGLRPVYAALDVDYPRYVRNHGRYRVIDGNIAGIRDALARAGADRLAVCSADPWKWSFLGLSLDGPFKVVAPGVLADPDDPGQAEVFVALDRAPGGPPPELAGYRLAENAAFVVYRMPRAVWAGLLPSLSCNTKPY
jgi:hypothetical protein